MRHLFIFILLCSSLSSLAQEYSLKSWQNEARKNKEMQPEYGNLKKNTEEIKADNIFVNNIVESGKSKSEGASEMIRIGFDYLYKGDLKTAMLRFNQAYLLHPKNSQIYWGYGAVYKTLGAYDLARAEYDKGLVINPTSTPILTDYGTTHLGDYYATIRSDYKLAKAHLSKARKKLLEAYSFDSKYINTTYKLSIIYLYDKDCENAKKYLKETRELGGQPITKEYLTDFNLRCGNCSKVQTGNFEIESARNGITKITRNKNYQIEENKSLGYKLKLKIDWIDECTYTLMPVEDLSKSKKGKVPTRVLRCQIIEVNDDNYIQVSKAEGEKRQITSQLNFSNQ